MKQILSLLLTMVLLLTLAISAMGMVHSSIEGTGVRYEYPFNAAHNFYSWGWTLPMLKTDTWFSVTKQPTPLVYAGVRSGMEDTYGVGFYQNDQTFVELMYDHDPSYDSDLTNFKGSYLLSDGIFIGLDYQSFSAANYTYLAPGYRYNFGDRGYLALSADYLQSDTPFYKKAFDLYCYELNFNYYWDNAKLSGQLFSYPTMNSQSVFMLQGDYRASETVTFGAEVFKDIFYDKLQYLAGITWSSDGFVIDGFYGSLGIPRSAPINQYIVVSGMYDFTAQFSSGAEFLRQTGGDRMYLTMKAKYTDNKNNFVLSYRLENADFDSELIIGYQYDL